mgnify:CR=1 FL=1
MLCETETLNTETLNGWPYPREREEAAMGREKPYKFKLSFLCFPYAGKAGRIVRPDIHNTYTRPHTIKDLREKTLQNQASLLSFPDAGKAGGIARPSIRPDIYKHPHRREDPTNNRHPSLLRASGAQGLLPFSVLYAIFVLYDLLHDVVHL